LQKYKISLNSVQNKKMLDKIQCCRANTTTMLLLLPYCRTATPYMQQCAATDDATHTPLPLPRYRHYCRYRCCRSIATAALSPLPRYRRHPIATLPPQQCLRSCRAAINDVALMSSPPLC
jgi:hypothetical protein